MPNDESTLKIIEREVIPKDTWIDQTDDGTIIYWKHSSPKRIYVKSIGKEIDADLPGEDDCKIFGANGSVVFLFSNLKIYQAVFTVSHGITVSYVRDQLENEMFYYRALCSIVRDGKQYVYRMGDDPIRDAILVDASLEDLKNLTIREIYRGNAIYQCESEDKDPVVKRMGTNVVVISMRDRLYLSAKDNFVYFNGFLNSYFYVLNVEKMEILPPLQFEGIDYIYNIIRVRDGVITARGSSDDQHDHLLIKAILPEEYFLRKNIPNSSENGFDDLLDECCCSICSKNFGATTCIPHVLDCGHTFCDECIGKMWKDNSVKCPMCSSSTSMPQSRILPTNFVAINMAERMMQSRVDPKIVCKTCERKCSPPSIRMCTKDDCNMFNQYICVNCALDGNHGGHVVKYDIIIEKIRKDLHVEVNDICSQVEQKKKNVLEKTERFEEVAQTIRENMNNSRIPQNVIDQMDNISSKEEAEEYTDIVNELAKTIIDECDNLSTAIDTTLTAANSIATD